MSKKQQAAALAMWSSYDRKQRTARGTAISQGIKAAFKRDPAARDRLIAAVKRGGKTRTRPLAERFWEKVDKSGPKQPHMRTNCWLWTGCTLPGRAANRTYGQIAKGGKYGGCAIAHRVAWELEHGKPGKKFVLHKCDTPLCVRASHLKLGTAADNTRDMVAKGRARGRHSQDAKL